MTKVENNGIVISTKEIQNKNRKRKGDLPMSMINKEVNNFSVQAFVDNSFKTVTKEDILGGWSVFFFYPADFTFVRDEINIEKIKSSSSGCNW